MKSRNKKLAVSYDLIEKGQLQYFFIPFFWDRVEYKFLREQNSAWCSKDVVSANAESSQVEVEISNVAVDAPTQDSNNSSNDILASYNNIVQRYKA